MDLQLTGKRAIVTGASQGIGLAIAHALAAEGADVVLAARSEDKLTGGGGAGRRAQRPQGRSRCPPTSPSDAAVQALVARTVSELGGIDILVNNASNQSIGHGFPRLAGTTDDVFWGDLDVKVLGYIRVARAVAPLLAEQGWGRIINVSGSGYKQTLSIVRTIRNVSVVALTKNLADELGPHGVNVTVVHPAGTLTDVNADRFDRPRPRQRDRPVRDRRRGGRRRRVPGFPAQREHRRRCGPRRRRSAGHG